MKVSDERRKAFHDKIFSWWAKHKRDLPWRNTHDPYKILISEVMLQQTQVSRVLPKNKAFLSRYPTVFALALATKADVLRFWQGLGYNRRALYLHYTAQRIVKDFKGIIPDNEQQLLTFPGMSKYTARAILVFAYKQDIAIVDTNIRQIIRTSFLRGKNPKEKEIQQVAEQLIPTGKAWEWHQALMDYGALGFLKTKLCHPVSSRRPQPPFKETNRYFRGRVVDSLRNGEVSIQEVIEEFFKKYSKEAAFTESIINGLVKDGLVVRVGSVLSLPE